MSYNTNITVSKNKFINTILTNLGNIQVENREKVSSDFYYYLIQNKLITNKPIEDYNKHFEKFISEKIDDVNQKIQKKILQLFNYGTKLLVLACLYYYI